LSCPALRMLIATVSSSPWQHPSVPASVRTGEHPSDGTKVLGGLCGVIHLSDVAPRSFPPQELLRAFISFPSLRPEFRPFRFSNIIISPKRIVGGFSSRPSAFTLAECTNYCTRPDPRDSFPHVLALLHAALSYCRHLFMPCPCAAGRSYPARCPGMASSAPLAPVHGSRGHDSKAA